ncbi:MAG: ATP-grasp domain-containing protein [Anaerovoracaceae bacterium]
MKKVEKLNQIAIILGGTVPHRELIEKLKMRGYYTLLIDFFDNPPAAVVSDEHLKLNALDYELVLKLAKERKADLVLSLCLDQHMAVASYVSEKLDLPYLVDYKSALDMTNKELMKEKMIKAGIATSKFMILSEDQEIAKEELKNFTYPLVVKPVDSNGSKGVRKVESEKQIFEFIEKAMFISRDKKVIIEEFVDGEEIQVDCFINKGKAIVLSIKKRIKIAGGENDSLQILGSYLPFETSTTFENHIAETLKTIVKAFKLETTSFFLQGIKSGERLSVLEFSSRIGGGLSTFFIKETSGIDLLELNIDALLSTKVSVNIDRNKKKIASNILYAKPGIFYESKGFEELLQDGIISHYFLAKTKGMEIGSNMDSGSRVACIVYEGENIEEIVAKSEIAMSRIQILNEKNENILITDLIIRKNMI